MKDLKTLIIYRKKLIFTLFVAGLALTIGACANKETKTDPDSIRKQITQYNQQIFELNQKVSQLEKELEVMGETSQNRVRTQVVVSELIPETFNHYVEVSGQVEAVRSAVISPEISGQVRQINVIKGQRVRAGQVLARLNTSVIETNITELKTSLQLAETVYNRQQRLWEQQIGSEMQYLESKNNYESLQVRLRTLEAQLAMAEMKAPFEGVVDEVFTKVGELAMPGSPIMMVLNLNELYINADVSESFLPTINNRDRVILRFPAFPDYEAQVPIFRLGNTINPENRTFRVQLKVANDQERFKPNMVASVSIRSFTAPDALVVPSILIKQDVQGHYVYVARKNSEDELAAHKVYVERGIAGEGKTLIVSGLQAGDQLIVIGHNRVSDGTLITLGESGSLAGRN